MSMKKTDLEKQLAKKIDGRMKKGVLSQRFGAGSVAAGAKARAKDEDAVDASQRPGVAKLVPVSVRLPTELVQRLREEAVAREGGLSAVMTMAAEQWLASVAGRAEP